MPLNLAHLSFNLLATYLVLGNGRLTRAPTRLVPARQNHNTDFGASFQFLSYLLKLLPCLKAT